MTLTLTTLGTTDLRSGDREIRAVLQQPKRLALLVYLVTGRPGKMVRRDSLLVLFWPELDQEHARAALRRSLYFLRQACGSDVLVGRGDEEVGVERQAVQCDALQFDSAIDGNDLETALRLYRGNFLEGFYIQGAADAEEWLDRERSRRRYDAALAAWQLARRPRDDLAVTARWAQRAIDLAPQDQDAVQSFLLELEKRGERGLAERLYEQVAERLLTDAGIEPNSELKAIAERIRSRPARTQQTAEWSVAVCPFSVRGDPSLAYLSEGMVDLLGTKLDGTGPLRTVDSKALLRAAPRNASGGTDNDAGGIVARQLGAKFFLTGAILESGGRLEAGLGLYDVDGRLAGRAEGRAEGENGLFEMVDELVRRLVADLDRSAAGRLTRLAALTTSSLPALKAYLTGEREFRLGRHLQAIDLLRRATSEDSSFALAYYRLASSLAATALIGPAREASMAAYTHRERLSDHDRLLLEAQHAWLHGHTADAERRYAALTVGYPEQVDPWYLLGDLLFHTNSYRGRTVADARGPLERALQLDPTHIGALTHLTRIAALEGRIADVQGLVSRALELSPAADQAVGLRVLAAFAGGDAAAIRSATAELTRAPGLAIARAFADVALYLRDLDAAADLAGAILPTARSAEFAALGNIMLAHLELARGRPARAVKLLRTAGRHEPAWALEVRALFAALPEGGTGDAELGAVEAELTDWDPATAVLGVALPLVFHDGLHGHLRLYLLGLLAGRRGSVEAVVARAEELSELGVPHGMETAVEQMARTLDALGLTLQGKPADGLSQLERLKTDLWFQFAVGSPILAGTYQRFLRADLLERVGRIDEARSWWRTIAQRSPYELILAEPARRRAATSSGSQ